MNQENKIQMYIEIGKIVEAKARSMDFRFHLKQFLKKTGHNLDGARKDLSSFGMYGDCGDSYETAYREAVGLEQGVLMFKAQLVRMEKYYKMCIHRFKENYPEGVDLLEKELNKKTQEIFIYLQKKTPEAIEAQKNRVIKAKHKAEQRERYKQWALEKAQKEQIKGV